MKYHGEYEVDPAFIKDSYIKWVFTGNGEYIIGEKDGKRYFIKRNIHVRRLSAGSRQARAESKTKAEALEAGQKALAKAMKGLSFSTDGIVVEEKHFWDGDNMFVTVTACVDGGLSEDYDYKALSQAEFTELARATATVLQKLHARAVIHGDLKEKNIVVVKKGGKYIPNLIDFDSSYLADAVPEWEGIGGTFNYQSPEVVIYDESEGKEGGDTIAPATDIFSLGVVLHRWWTGTLPSFDPKYDSLGSAIYNGDAPAIDKKFDVRIGDGYGATLMSLINWMLAKDPAARPSAEQVAAVLCDGLDVPEEFQRGDDFKPFDKELWDVHKAVADLYTVATLKKKGVKSFKRVNTGSGSTGLKYCVTLSDGTVNTLSVEEVIASGYGKALKAAVDEPWEGHRIKFESADVISQKGYAKIARAQQAFRKRYLVMTNTGRQFDKGCEWLISEGLAKYIVDVIEADTPWPEHGSRYVPENMSLLGVKSISRVEVGGEHRYKIVYNEKSNGKNVVNDKVAVNNLMIMGFIE